MIYTAIVVEVAVVDLSPFTEGLSPLPRLTMWGFFVPYLSYFPPP